MPPSALDHPGGERGQFSPHIALRCVDDGGLCLFGVVDDHKAAGSREPGTFAGRIVGQVRDTAAVGPGGPEHQVEQHPGVFGAVGKAGQIYATAADPSYGAWRW